VIPPGEDVAVYKVIVDPLLAGAVKATVAVVCPVFVAVPIVGAPGTAIGVIEVVADDATESPTPFVAMTVKVYAVPAVKPETVMLPLPGPAIA